MSADASRRISALAPPWLRYGLIAGIIAFSCTLTANLAVTWLSPADLCRVGFIVPLLSLGALIIFLAMAAAAGFKTARAGAPAPAQDTPLGAQGATPAELDRLRRELEGLNT